MAEIARHLVDKGLVDPDEEERAAKEIEAKMAELLIKAEEFKAKAINTEPLIP